MKVRVIGIDLGKTVLHLIGMDEHGSIVLKKRFSRFRLLQFLVNTPACLIGMEASCGCHHIARKLGGLGHQVRLIPAQFVKPYVKSQKNDYRDAEAITEAVPAADDAVRSRQDGRSAGCASAASGARTPHGSAN